MDCGMPTAPPSLEAPRLRLAALGAGIVLAVAALPAPADAAVHTLRPDSPDSDQGWTMTPAATPLWDVLDDEVVAPALPPTATDYTSATQSTILTANLESVTIPAGGTVTGVTAWAYLQPGSNRTLTFYLAHGA